MLIVLFVFPGYWHLENGVRRVSEDVLLDPDGLPHVLVLVVLSGPIAFRAYVGSGLGLGLGLENFPIVLTVSRHTAIRRSSRPSSL